MNLFGNQTIRVTEMNDNLQIPSPQALFPYSLSYLVIFASAQNHQELKMNRNEHRPSAQHCSTKCPGQTSHAVYTQVLQSDIGLPASCFCLRGSVSFGCFVRKRPQETKQIAEKSNTQVVMI